MIVTLIFNCLLAGLLIATISYCSKLSRRIKTLQDGRSELAGMIAQFDTATNRAIASVNELQTVSKKIVDSLQLKIDKANFLADDLAFLIEKSNKLILQLEQQSKQLTNENKKQGAGQIIKNDEAKHFEKLIAQIASPQVTKPSNNEKPRTSIEDIYNVKPHNGPAISDSLEAIISAETRGPRTGAERELLEALKSIL